MLLMKRMLAVLFILSLCIACSSDDNGQRNPFLNELSFQYQANLSLPQFDDIRFPGGSVYVAEAGIRGIIIFNLNDTTFLAWEASCPNQTPNACSTMEASGGLATCPCDGYQYSLGTGGAIPDPETGEAGQYPLLNYSARLSGNSVVVSN